MNHDIAHCDGSRCKCRNTCYRYKAHIDLMQQDTATRIAKGNYIASVTCTERNYDCYWPIGEHTEERHQ